MRPRLTQCLAFLAVAAAGCNNGTEPSPPVSLASLPLDSWATIQPFGAWNPNFGGYHLAVDAVAPAGTIVRAADDGQVLFAEPGVTGYGALVLIIHDLPGGPVTTLYGHLSTRQGLAVATGDQVVAGQPIGVTAEDDEDGGAWGPHLHFGVRRGAAGIDAERCGVWPYVGYTRSCEGWTHERFRDQWLDPHDVLPIFIAE